MDRFITIRVSPDLTQSIDNGRERMRAVQPDHRLPSVSEYIRAAIERYALYLAEFAEYDAWCSEQEAAEKEGKCL